ncbi:MAG: DUF2147 domain-containing protein [Marinibacterium sp.]|nr:DUF2147 domain-containing protein [Marinibacterium sp.]
MRTFLTGLALSIGVAGAASADPIYGTWQTEVDGGTYAHVDMAACGSKICGTLAQAYDGSGKISSPDTGKQIVFDMNAKGGGKYEGKVWRPSNDKVYLGKMDLNGNKLALRGCVAGGLICAKQTWTRVK